MWYWKFEHPRGGIGGIAVIQYCNSWGYVAFLPGVWYWKFEHPGGVLLVLQQYNIATVGVMLHLYMGVVLEVRTSRGVLVVLQQYDIAISINVLQNERIGAYHLNDIMHQN